ncbi:Rieske (2Fe-2S) protein [Streptomyces mangrovisoli]|uniref:Cytochrome bc1 complex Rieske iron-sulfur subunit n=1 Tax=Streptomyces mangrovisoli TaxID=1428628 RepID=A0A1J4NQB1_9ACTN|nr:Rieske (2Fe-2S) protein [Streptomyces mangrovisoli]OIJ64559.1 iron-sulfur protein [Streptomyces mangrovisoli]
MTHPPTRRTVLGAGAAALAVGCAGCSSYGDGNGSSSSSAAATSGQELGHASEVPVGGGKVFTAEKVVVTQPKKGEFKAFSAVCTHQGCTVNAVEDGLIQCPCHGSRFRIADASVAAGPAPKPLPPRRITVSGDTITLA